MPTGVELDTLLDADLGCYVGGVHGAGLGFEEVVEVGDVGLVVLAVVEFHDLGGDVGFQRLRVVSFVYLWIRWMGRERTS